MKKIVRYEDFECPTAWWCSNLKNYVYVANESIAGVNHGWLCDCGEWVENDDLNHNIIFRGVRKRCIIENEV